MTAETLSRPGSDSRIVRAADRIRGTVRVPGDKSISHRAALFNAVADGRATVTNFSPGADCAATLACLRQLGVHVTTTGDRVEVHGVGSHGLAEPADVLDCANSGTTMRLLCGLLAGAGVFAVLTGDASLRRRPMARVAEPLRGMGSAIAGRDRGRLPPLAIAPSPRLHGIEHLLAVASGQVKSALLLAGLAADGATTVLEPARSRDHTERLLSTMGANVEVAGSRITIQPGAALRATDMAIPGDFSSAAFWLVLGCLHPNAHVRITDVGLNPTRTGLLDVLRAMGGNVHVENASEVAGEPVGDLVAESSALRGTTVAGALVPLAIDELPLIALLGLFAAGETVVRDAAELRSKESDRIAAAAEGLRALGGDLVATADGWRITGGARLQPARVSSHGDHRIAMLLALAGALGAGAEITEADAVSVSYPGFWQTLDQVTA